MWTLKCVAGDFDADFDEMIAGRRHCAASHSQLSSLAWSHLYWPMTSKQAQQERRTARAPFLFAIIKRLLLVAICICICMCICEHA